MTQAGGIVWLASYPKSGNTWFRIFLANLAAGENGPADINSLDDYGGLPCSRSQFENATLLDSGLLSHDDIDRLRPRVYEAAKAEMDEQRWIKVHDAYTLTPDGEPLLGRDVAYAAIYLVRDPRDVAVSFAHHINISIDATIALMNASDGALCGGRMSLAPALRQTLLDWSGHVVSWIEQTDIPVHWVRYEDLVAAPVKCFTAALEFANREATPEAIERAIGYADFAELQRLESEKGFAERMSRTAPFFRSGKVGGWRETLTSEQVNAIEQCHGVVMRRLGYPC